MGYKILVDDNLNTNQSFPKGNDQDEYIITDMATEVLKYMSANFLLLHTSTWVRYGQTWSMTCLGQDFQFSMDYLMGHIISCFINSLNGNRFKTRIIKWS